MVAHGDRAGTDLGAREMAKRRSICAGLLIAAVAVAQMPSAAAIETTYGEDPVPNSHCTDDFIDLGYGIDPIPAKSPSQRWNEWRLTLGKAPAVGAFRRQVGQPRVEQQQIERPQIEPPQRLPAVNSAPSAASQPSTVRRPADMRPSSRRAFQTQPAPRQF